MDPAACGTASMLSRRRWLGADVVDDDIDAATDPVAFAHFARVMFTSR